jgi:hypothetical protein
MSSASGSVVCGCAHDLGGHYHHRRDVHAGTALATAALAVEVQSILAAIRNIDAPPVARDSGHDAAAPQDAYLGHAAEVDQLLSRAVQRGVEERLRRQDLLKAGRRGNAAEYKVSHGRPLLCQ